MANLFLTLASALHWAIQVYIIIIIVRSIISWMGTVPPNQFTYLLRRLTDPVFRLVYRLLPHHILIVGNIDISPLIIITALYLLDTFATNLLIDFARQFGRI